MGQARFACRPRKEDGSPGRVVFEALEQGSAAGQREFDEFVGLPPKRGGPGHAGRLPSYTSTICTLPPGGKSDVQGISDLGQPP